MVAPLLLGDGLEFFSEPLPFPLLLLQGLALGPQLGFGGIPGAAALAKAGLQIALLAFQGGAACLVGLMPLFPGGALGHQGIHRRHQPLFVGGEGFELVADAFGGEGPLAPGRQQVIPLAAGQGQGLVRSFQLGLQALPAGGIPGGLGGRLGGLEAGELELERLHGFFELLLALQIGLEGFLQLHQTTRELLLPLQLGREGPLGGTALGLQGGLALLALQQLGPDRFEALAELRFLAAAGQEAFAEFEQPAAQGFGLITVLAAAKAELAAPLLEAAARHGPTLLEQFAIEGYGPATAQFPAGIGQVVEDQGVAKDVAEDFRIHRFMAHEIHRLAHQATCP